MCRRLDASVAEALGKKWDENRCKICGWPLKETMEEGCVKGDCSMRPVPKPPAIERIAPRYSGDGNAMLELIGEMVDRYWFPIMHPKNGAALVSFHHVGDPPKRGVEAAGSTLPLAVALAAYKALTGKEWIE